MNADVFASMAANMLREPRPRKPTKVDRNGQSVAKVAYNLLKERGPMTSAQLAESLELASTRNVWGNLHAMLVDGRLERSEGMWRVNDDWMQPYVVMAIEALRAAGWELTPPPPQVKPRIGGGGQ